MKQFPSSGGMTTQNTITTVEIRDNAYWPDEARLIDFAEQDARAEMADRMEPAKQPLEIGFEYATLYFGS
jgi:hypothetical protein